MSDVGERLVKATEPTRGKSLLGPAEEFLKSKLLRNYKPEYEADPADVKKATDTFRKTDQRGTVMKSSPKPAARKKTAKTARKAYSGK